MSRRQTLLPAACQMILKLPTPPLTMRDVDLQLLDGKYEITDAPHSTKELTAIDTNSLELRMALSVHGERHPDINATLRESMQEVIDEGYLFAGARVAAALLRHPEAIPDEWRKIADTDWFYEKSGSLTFWGSSLEPLESGRPSSVLSIFYARGRWSGGYQDRFYDEATVESLRKEDIHVLRDYFVVYREG